MSEEQPKYLNEEKKLTEEQQRAIEDMINYFKELPFKNNISVGMMEKYLQTKREINLDEDF
jgi:hypothetical protein